MTAGSLNVSFFDDIPSIKIECEYNGAFKCYGGIYTKVVKWKDVKSAVTSIKRKHKAIIEAEERERMTE